MEDILEKKNELEGFINQTNEEIIENLETASEVIEETKEGVVEAAGEALEEAKEEIGEAAGEVSEKIDEASEKPEENTSEASETAEEKSEESAEEASEATEEASTESVEDTGENIDLKITWHKEDAEELKAIVYNHAEDMTKKGDKPEFIMWLCAGVAAVCFIVMLGAGLKSHFSTQMIVLMVCYVAVMFLSLFTPLHVKVSNMLWNKNFEKRFLVNKGCKEDIVLIKDSLMYKGKDGAYNQIMFDDFEGIYESENYIIFHKNDYKILAVKVSELDEGMRAKIMARITEKKD